MSVSVFPSIRNSRVTAGPMTAGFLATTGWLVIVLPLTS